MMWIELAVAVAAAQSEWPEGWSHRRTLTVTDTVRGSHAADVAVAEIPTLGVISPDGSDLRIFDREGKKVPLAVLACGFEDRALVAFEFAYRGGYTLYFGNPKAKPLPGTADFKAGLMLEVRELGDGVPKDWAAMQRILEKSRNVVGRWWVPNFALGFNPLGPWTRGIFDFKGTLDCRTDGTYGFAINALDASFLLVDDQMVAQWPGWHGAGGGGENALHQGKVELKAGVHRIRYVNAFHGHGACTVGWQRPSDKRIAPIPTEAFAGYYVARPGPAETREGLVADFLWSFEEDLGFESRKVTSVKFVPLTAGKAFRWEFGDGVTSRESTPTHVFLEAATFAVTCEADGKSTTQKVRVQPTRGHAGRAYERRIKDFADRIRDYPTEGLSGAACFELGSICHEANRMDTAARGFRAALEKGYRPQEVEEGRWIVRLYEIYRDNERFDDAIWVCDWVVRQNVADPFKVAALNLKAEILYDYQDKAQEADACSSTVLERYRSVGTDYVRAAYIRSGEYALARGDREAARKILEDAETSSRWKRWKGDMEITEGAHSINFEESLRRGEFDAALKEIVSWVWERPTVIWSGLPRHLRGRLFLARKQTALALREFERALAVDPRASFADEALFWKGEALESLLRKDEARACFERIVKEFPESSLAAKAKEKLQ